MSRWLVKLYKIKNLVDMARTRALCEQKERDIFRMGYIEYPIANVAANEVN